MAVSFVNAQQPRIDAWIQPGCRADIAVVSTESWPVDTVVTIGVADAAGVIAVPLLTITPDLATLTATVALTGVQVAALAVACPPPYGVIDWQWRTGAGSPLGVGSLHWDLTGARTTQTVTVMMGPAGPGATPEAISALVEDYLVAHPPTGSGDVTGPASAVAGNLAALDATGKILSDSGSKPADFAPASHNHAGVYDPAGTAAGLVGGITPASIGAQPTGSYAPALGPDDNYLTDTEKAQLHTHPAVIAQGATQADARTAIGAGTSSLVIGTTGTTAAAGDHLHDARYIRTVNGTGPDGAGNVTVAGGGGTAIAPCPGPPVGRTVTPAWRSCGNGGGIVVPAGTAIFIPFLIGEAMSVDRLVAVIDAAGGAGSVARFGMYTLSGGAPQSLLYQSGTFAGASGDKFVGVSPSWALSPGWVLLALVHNDSAGTLKWRSTNSDSFALHNIFGYQDGTGAVSDPMMWMKTPGYDAVAGFPATATVSSPSFTSWDAPWATMRRSA